MDKLVASAASAVRSKNLDQHGVINIGAKRAFYRVGIDAMAILQPPEGMEIITYDCAPVYYITFENIDLE